MAWRRFSKLCNTPQFSTAVCIYEYTPTTTAQLGECDAIQNVKMLTDLDQSSLVADMPPAAYPSAIMRATHGLPPLMRSRILRLLLLNWCPQVIVQELNCHISTKVAPVSINKEFSFELRLSSKQISNLVTELNYTFTYNISTSELNDNIQINTR